MREITGSLAESVHTRKPASGEARRWIDVDSSVKGVSGHQQGAQKGFNPHKKGQKSYHPPGAFRAGSKEVIHSRWRGGNAHPANGAGSFLKETLPQLPEGQTHIFRADSGFYGDEFFTAIEAASGDHKYLVKVKRKNLGRWVAAKDWQSVPGAPASIIVSLTTKPPVGSVRAALWACASWKKRSPTDSSTGRSIATPAM